MLMRHFYNLFFPLVSSVLSPGNPVALQHGLVWTGHFPSAQLPSCVASQPHIGQIDQEHICVSVCVCENHNGEFFVYYNFTSAHVGNKFFARWGQELD